MHMLGISAEPMFAQNVEKLRKAPATSQFSKKDRAALHEALAKLSDLWVLRCDAAHGRLSILDVDGSIFGCIVNPLRAAAHGRPALLVTASELDAASEMMRELAREVSGSVARSK